MSLTNKQRKALFKLMDSIAARSASSGDDRLACIHYDAERQQLVVTDAHILLVVPMAYDLLAESIRSGYLVELPDEPVNLALYLSEKTRAKSQSPTLFEVGKPYVHYYSVIPPEGSTPPERFTTFRFESLKTVEKIYKIFGVSDVGFRPTHQKNNLSPAMYQHDQFTLAIHPIRIFSNKE